MFDETGRLWFLWLDPEPCKCANKQVKKSAPRDFVSDSLTRREMILRAGVATLGLGLAGLPVAASAGTKTNKVLFFSKSSGFEHSVIKRTDGQPSFVEKVLTDLGSGHGIQFACSKDGSLFTPEYLAGFDAYVFYTTGDLTVAGTDKNPPMSPEGKAAFLDAIANGKGFVGIHSATDTFHTRQSPGTDPTHYHNDDEKTDPFIQMLGAEFIIHGQQQKATLRAIDARFPGMTGKDITLTEEWYSLKNFADDLHVLLVQETEGMQGLPYQRPPYPSTWARRHGKGRVFYTSMGHREDVWSNPVFQEILFGGIAWTVGAANADVTPDVKEVTPRYRELPPK